MPTRAGNGATIPSHLTADRPAIVIDPKGENLAVFGRARSTFGPVYTLDPFGITGAQSVAYNPPAAIDPAGNRVLEDAKDIAEAIVADLGGDGDAAHWNGEAGAHITDLILHRGSSETSERRHLGCVRECLTLPPDQYQCQAASCRWRGPGESAEGPRESGRGQAQSFE